MTTEQQEKPQYRSRVTERVLDKKQPGQAMPAKLEQQEWQVDSASGLSLKLVTLLLGIGSFIAFSVVEAVDGLTSRFASAPISTSILGALLGGFVVCLIALIFREWRGFRAVGSFVEDRLNIEMLTEQDNPAHTLDVLTSHASKFGKHSYAKRCYKQFDSALHQDMSNQEVLDLYQRTVAAPVTRKADEILRRESVVSGSLTFISPNHLIQTLVIMWISFRTLRRVAQVFGLRPGTAGSWRLFKVLAQNLAAQSLFDIATDEISNQISGSLAAKFMENSAEAVAAGALNVRLGKVLIRLLR